MLFWEQNLKWNKNKHNEQKLKLSKISFSNGNIKDGRFSC